MLSSELIRTIRRIEIHTRHLVNDSFAGEYQSVFKGRGMEFDEVREYQPGDEIRSIEWNVTARMGKPYVKRYVEERELTVMLAFDASASGLFGTADRLKRSLAAELGAVMAFSAITNNDKVGLLAFTDKVELFIPPRKGRSHVLRLIRDLLAFEPTGFGTNITVGLDRLNRILKRHAIIFLISDFQMDYSRPDIVKAYEKTLTITNRRHDLVAISVTDPREVEFPDVGIVVLEDAESGSQIRIDSSHSKWRQAFAEKAKDHQLSRDAAFSRAQVDHINITAGADYIAPLLRFFKLRARRWRR